MRIGWQTSAGGNERVYLPAQLTVPARYNFMQGYIYRLKLTDIPGREGVQLYPTIEVAPSTPPTDAYLTHNPIPIQFTPEDFDQVIDGGNFVTKVIYLPDPKYQELAIAGVETLVSTRLEPGVDPILEADKRGTILLVVRLGAIDLEMPDTGTAGAVIAPGTVVTQPGAPGATALPPGSLPPGRMMTSPIPSVPLETPAPVTPAARRRSRPRHPLRACRRCRHRRHRRRRPSHRLLRPRRRPQCRRRPRHARRGTARRSPAAGIAGPGPLSGPEARPGPLPRDATDQRPGGCATGPRSVGVFVPIDCTW